MCYLRGGEGRQLRSSAWPPCTALGLTHWPACLSVCPAASLFIKSFYLNPPTSVPLSCAHCSFLTYPLVSPPNSSSCYPASPPPPPPPHLQSQALHWIFHHKPPAACQSKRTLPPEAPTEGPASDIKGNKMEKIEQEQRWAERQWASQCEISCSFSPIFWQKVKLFSGVNCYHLV